METKEISFTDKRGKQWSVKVQEATSLMGMRRSVMRQRAPNGTAEDIPEHILHYLTYPDLVSCTIEASGFDSWPVGFEEFAELPDQLVMEWESAVYELNPHWLPQDEESAEKNAEGAVPGSTEE